MRNTLFICVFLTLAGVMGMADSNPNPIPFVNQLLPESASPGSKGFILTIEGAGFAPGAVVKWNGSPRTTEVVSDDLIKADIKASDVSEIGTARVTVSNPRPGGGASSAFYFPIRYPLSKVALAPHNSIPTSGRVAYGDFNNDGILDVAVGGLTDNQGTISVFLGNGDGTFQKPVVTNLRYYPGVILAADFNGDGKLDLVAGQESGDGCGGYLLTFYFGKGDGHFKTGPDPDSVGGTPTSVADFNGDGKLDLLTTGYSYDCGGEYADIWLGKGDGTFTDVQTLDDLYGMTTPAIGDFNGDGTLDLATTFEYSREGNSVAIYLGNGDGTFQNPVDYPTQNSGSAAVAFDVNGDGNLDVVTNGISVLLGKGDGTFTVTDSTSISGNGLALGDMNGDGKVDVASSSAGNIVAVLGNGDGTFQNPIVGASGSDVLGLGDFNLDGRLDVLSSTPLLHLGTTAGVSPTSVAFGNQNVGVGSQPQAITLSNIGTKKLAITSIRIGGVDPQDFSQTDNCGKSIPAQGSCQIQVVFDPTVVGPRLAEVAIHYRDSGSPQTVPLSGKGITTTVSLTPSSMTFATQLINTASSPQVATLTNTGTYQVNISTISAPAPFSQTNNCPFTLYSGQSCDTKVVFTPQNAGTANGTLSVTDDATGSPQTVALSGTGTVVKLSPIGINFGDQKVGTRSAPVPVTLTNQGNTSLSISQITITGNNAGDFSQKNNCGSRLPAGGHCTIKVTFAPQAQGQRLAAVSISDNGGGSPQTVQLLGNGT